jgi:hypothetical protein
MPTDSTDRYRAFDLARFHLGENRELVYSPLSRAARTLPALTVRLLQGCRTFATLDEHAFRLCQELNLGPDQVPAVRAQLAALAGADLLVSARSLVGAGPSLDAQAPPRIAVLGVPTRNRPDALRRCLASYAEASVRHGRAPEYVVLDDSDSAETRQENRQALAELRTRLGVGVWYAGPEEKNRFAETLCRQAGLPAEVGQFALVNSGEHSVATGANRNALLLHTVGDLVLSVDDDTVCSLAPAPEVQGGLCLSSQFDPTEFWFPAEGESAGSPGSFQDEALLSLHEQLLGRDVGACLSAAGAGDLDLGPAGLGLFQKLRAGDGRVLATMTGVRGDSGMASSVYFVSLDGSSRARLLCSEAVYRQALLSHQLMRAVRRPTVCEPGLCMALNLGLDSRRLLPPFVPMGRNQDGVFASILRSCFPGAFLGFLPWLVQHQRPTPRRPGAIDIGTSAAQVSSGQVIQSLAGSFTPGFERRDVAANLRALGKTLGELGRAARADFEEVVRLHLWNGLSGLASRLDGQLRAYGGQPDFWAADARRILTVLGETLPEPRYLLPTDLRATGDRDALAMLQQCLGRFGRLLECWPDLVEAARDLRAGQVRLACPV